MAKCKTCNLTGSMYDDRVPGSLSSYVVVMVPPCQLAHSWRFTPPDRTPWESSASVLFLDCHTFLVLFWSFHHHCDMRFSAPPFL